MPTVRTALNDPASLERAMTPRDDLFVREEAVAEGRFVGVEGPFVRWERTVEPSEGPGGSATETLTYRGAAPHWRPLVDHLLRGPARRGIEPGAHPVWAPSDRLSQRDATVLGLCATLALISGFLGGLVGQTIAFIVSDLGGDTGTQANALAVIRAGAVLTFVATALADRRGRRPLMGACLVGASIATLVCAVAPNLAVVTSAQVVARGLVAGAAFLVPIICAEELPARSRAYSVGLMLLPGGLGAGVVLWFLPILDLADWAWRLLFLLGAPALVLAVRTVRRLPESRRFEHDDHIVGERTHQHVRPARLALLAAGMFLLNIFTAPTQQLQADYLKNTRGLSATAIAAFMVLTNTWGFVGVAVGARIADQRSRRLAATIGLLGLAVGNSLMFSVGGLGMWGASLLGSVVGAVTAPSLGAILPELFPTLRRGAANGLLNGAAVVGSVTGLLVVSHFVTGGDYGPTIMALALGPALVAVLVWGLPESAGVELETLNPDD